MEPSVLVFHNNGYREPTFKSRGYLYFEQITRQLLQDESIRNTATPCDLDIVLCHNYHKSITEDTLRHIGVTYHVMGQGINVWKNVIKVQLMIDFVEKSHAEYIMHLDGNDVAVCGDPAEIVRRFEKRNDCDVLFNREQKSYPYPEVLKRDDLSGYEKIQAIEQFENETYNSLHTFLNSGCYIGKRDAVLDLLKEVWALKGFIGRFPNSDQALFREMHRRKFPQVQLDAHDEIFQCLFYLPKERIKTRYTLSDSVVSRIGQTQLLVRKSVDIGRDKIRSLLRSVGRTR